MTNYQPETPAFLRPHLARLPAYTPIEPFEVLSDRLGLSPEHIIKLDANENPYGPSPKARQALAELSFPHIYPDPESRLLRQALEAFTGVPVKNLLVGSGADELIDLLLRVFLEPGDVAISCPPTFGMYAFDTRVNGGHILEIRRRSDFSLDLGAIQKAVAEHRPKLLFLTSPNNPDGSLIPAGIFEEILKLPVLVVLDEAYIEFCDNDSLGRAATRIQRVTTHENLIVLRTFSKWAGLAGLRVGYGAFPDWLMPTLWKAKQPYNVNVAASAAALASLEDLTHLENAVDQLRVERQRLFTCLQEIPYLKPYPSQSNFILCQVDGQDAAHLKAFLSQAHGILVRYFNTPGLLDHIRISAGRPEDSQMLLEALKSYPDAKNNQPGTITPLQRKPVSSPVDQIIGRRAHIHRKTTETEVDLVLNLDGSGKHSIHSGIAFLDHMLTHLAVHGLFDIQMKVKGDIEIDPHHTVEDIALVVGQAFNQALGERAGLVRMAAMYVPMDETLAFVAVDFSGRPYAIIRTNWHTAEVGGIPTTLFDHFLDSFANTARCNLHARSVYGRDDHHQAEALFKALARALGEAVQIDPRRVGSIPSTKGTLD